VESLGTPPFGASAREKSQHPIGSSEKGARELGKLSIPAIEGTAAAESGSGSGEKTSPPGHEEKHHDGGGRDG